MTDAELFYLGINYYNGDTVACDYRKAAECFRQAAERGFAPAQYQLGRLYMIGKGVDVDATLAREWFEKAAAQGNEEAKRGLIHLKLLFIRSSISNFGSSSFDVAKEYALEILSLFDELSDPDVSDRFNQREAYRYLGMLTAAGHWKEKEALLRSKAYYEKGLPIHEALDTDAMYSYPIVLDNLGDVTGVSSYYGEAYEAACDIYYNAFDRLQDPDDKAMILSFLVMEKILGRFHPVDLEAAEQLNRIIGTLGSSNTAMYENYRDAIEKKRREIQPYSNYTPSYSSPSFSSSVETAGKKLKGFIGNLFK